MSDAVPPRSCNDDPPADESGDETMTRRPALVGSNYVERWFLSLRGTLATCTGPKAAPRP